jgi:DNA/RNA endonuclease YhcR with UshA esterase domain
VRLYSEFKKLLNITIMKRRDRFFVFVALLVALITTRQALAANADIVINEIGAYEASGHEWIEVWNKGVEPVDITDWKLWEENGSSQNHKLTVSTTDSIIAPGEFAVIVQDDNQFLLDYPNFLGSVFDSSFTLNESGEEIGLVDAQGNFIEKFAYTPAHNFSLQRKDPNIADYTSANWVEHASGNTVGMINVFDLPIVVDPTSTPATTTTTEPTDTTSTSTPSTENTENSQTTNSQQTNSAPVSMVPDMHSLRINELVVDPEDGNEWVEVYNNSSISFYLAGAMICDSRNTTSTCKKISGSVNGNNWLQIDLQTRSFLNNSGDSVILKNALGMVIDRIDYDQELAPDEGQSLARLQDGIDTDNNDDWTVTDTVTPGAANTISGTEEEHEEQTGSMASTTVKSTKTSAKKPPSIFVWNIQGPSSAAPNEPVIFNAEGTADPRGGSLSFLWVLENGVTMVGPELSTSFATSGTHIFSLFVTSTSGYSEEKKVEIVVDAGLSQNAEVIISEIFPNPDGSDTKEFIELKNNTTGAVNLFGWFLRIGSKKYTFLDNTFIPPEGFLVFYKAATKLSLVNTAGKVELLNKDKFLMDIVKYDKSQAGQSFSLVNNEWKWVAPSPGKTAVLGEVLGEKIQKETTVKKAANPKSSGPLIVNLTEVREGEKGQPAKIKGIVAVLPNVFGSQYFYIIDGGAGIQIYQSKKDFPPIGVGDLVEVTGAVSEANGIKRVNIKNSQAVDVLSLGNKINIVPLDMDSMDENMAGGLVEVSGEITEIKSTFMYVDDGADEIKVYFKKNAKIDKQKYTEGENVKVVGILEKTRDEWQVWPRSNDDIESLGMAEEVLGEKIVATNQTDETEKYILVTVVGVASLLLGFLAKAKGYGLLVDVKNWVKK